jgi:raffinose/stachyose/melibiose transport system permease protein
MGTGYQGLVVRNLVPYVFLAPAVVIFAAFLVIPMGLSFWYSLTDWPGVGAKHFVGIDNYKTVFTDADTQLALKNTVIWTLVLITVPTLLGLGLATVLRGRERWKAGAQAIFYLPAVLPLVGVALIWQWMYNPQFGFVNAFLQKVGLGSLAVDWLGTTSTAVPALMISAVWVSVGFPMVLYLSGLQTIPDELYEAARMDGARRWNLFRHVTLPGLRQLHIVIIALEVILALQAFAIIYALTAGGPGNSTQILGTWMYANLFSFNKVGYGSAVGWVLTAMGLAVAIPYVLWMTRDE